MMIYARPPTLEDHGELRRMTREAIGRVSQRAHLIVLSAQRHSVPELATLFGMSRATVRFWIRRFDACGPAGLSEEPRRGRPRQLGSHELETMLTMRQADPQHAGSLATFWTVAMLALAGLHRLGVHLSTRALRDALRELELRWGRPRLAMPLKVDPAKARLQWLIATAGGLMTRLTRLIRHLLVPRQAHRHTIPLDLCVVSRRIPGGLHHENRLEKKVA